MKIETNTYTQNLTWTLFPIDNKVYNTDVYTKSDIHTLFVEKPHKTDLYMKSNVDTLR